MRPLWQSIELEHVSGMLRSTRLLALALMGSVALINPVAHASDGDDQAQPPQQDGDVGPTAPVRAPRLITHPDGPGELAGRVALGISFDVTPTQIVEGAPRRIPTFNLDTRVGLPAGFSLLTELRTQFVTTWLRIGPGWSFEAGPVGFMLGYLAVPYFGWLGQFGFETLSWGFSNSPIVRAGLHFGRVHLTLEIGAEISFGRWARLGGSVVDESKGVQYLGGHAMITVENELTNGGLLTYRIGLLARQGNAVLWAAFSDETARLYYPRIEVAYGF